MYIRNRVYRTTKLHADSRPIATNRAHQIFSRPPPLISIGEPQRKGHNSWIDAPLFRQSTNIYIYIYIHVYIYTISIHVPLSVASAASEQPYDVRSFGDQEANRTARGLSSFLPLSPHFLSSCRPLRSVSWRKEHVRIAMARDGRTRALY